MAEKAKATATNLFAKTKTVAMRATQKAMVKLGKAEETVDIQFNQESSRFTEHYKAVKKVKKDAKQLLKLLQDLAVQQALLADDLCGMFDNRSSNYNATLKNQDIAKQLEQARLVFDEVIKKDFLDPTSKYLGQFKEAKERIAERNTRCVDMDRYGRDVRSLQEKAAAQAKVHTAEQKYEAAATNYHNLNDELLNDLPKLYEDRMPFFQPLLATYSIGLAEFYKQSSQSTSAIVGMVSQIDRQAVHNHQRIITATESSAATFKATVGAGMSNSFYKAEDAHHGSDYSNASAPPMNAPSNPIPPPSFTPHKAMPVPPVKSQQAKALYDFNPQESNELGFKFGDIITIHSMKGDWWEGELHGKKGLLPSNYVQLL